MTTSEEKEDEYSASFSLQNTSQTFLGRSNDIFASLDALEQKHEAYEKNRKESGQLESDEHSLLKLDPDEEVKTAREEPRRGRREKEWKNKDLPTRDRSRIGADRSGEHKSSDQEGPRSFPGSFQFQAPRGRAPRSDKTPDFRKHPDKWTHYSLKDVEAKDMSESSNTKAAFAFLEERRKQREKEMQEMGTEAEEIFNTNVAACSKGIISFSRPGKQPMETDSKPIKENLDDTDVLSGTGSGKFINEFNDELGIEKVENAESFECGPQPSTSFKNRKGIKRNIRSRENDN